MLLYLLQFKPLIDRSNFLEQKFFIQMASLLLLHCSLVENLHQYSKLLLCQQVSSVIKKCTRTRYSFIDVLNSLQSITLRISIFRAFEKDLIRQFVRSVISDCKNRQSGAVNFVDYQIGGNSTSTVVQTRRDSSRIRGYPR